MNALEFLKKYSSIPNEFLTELYNMYDENTKPYDLCINLESVAKWLSVNKTELMKTLRNSYSCEIDYIIKKAPNPNKKDPRNNNYKLVLITPDCFKRVCMLTRSRRGEDVRTYFIEVEKLLLKYNI
jgi:phage anti-repressor protein